MVTMAFCSAVTLCFASIFSLFSAALLAIAFSTDNWENIKVDRDVIKVSTTTPFKLEILGLEHSVLDSGLRHPSGALYLAKGKYKVLWK